MEDQYPIWTDNNIREYYDNHPNLTLREFSVITGISIINLKLILMHK